MDILEQADAYASALTAEALANVRATPRMQPNGECRYCQEPVAQPKLFCDNFCRDDFEHERKIKLQQGRVR